MSAETPRGVSSKLLTMKFMQRAAASASSSSPASEAPSSKRRKVDSPSAGRIRGDIDQASIQAAVDAQENTRRSALEQHASADTHWVLNTSLDVPKPKTLSKESLNVVYVGYGDIDSADEGDGEDAPQNGRTSTRKKKQPASADGGDQGSSDDDDGSSERSSAEGDDSGASKKRKAAANGPSSSQNSRSGSRSRTRGDAEDAKAKDYRDKRRKKDVRLNKITSISSGGGSNAGSSSTGSGKKLTCFKCQEPGHIAAECPNRSSRSSGRGR